MQIRLVTLLYLKMNVAANDLPDVIITSSGLCCVIFCDLMSKKVIVPGSRTSQLLCYFVGFSNTEICVVCVFIFQ